MNRSFKRRVVGALSCIAVLGLFAIPASAQTEQQKLVDDAEKTLSNFLRDPQMTWLQANIGSAKAVLISPKITKAGFIIGGSGGHGLVVAKQGAKAYGPAFYTLATASFGFQAGVSVSEMVTLVMTEKGLNSLLSSSFKLGGDASIAAGPVGAGAKSNVVADLVSFTLAKGIYGGVNLDGTVVKQSEEWNKAYYGKDVMPPDILIKGAVHNKAADPLLAAVAKATTPSK